MGKTGETFLAGYDGQFLCVRYCVCYLWQVQSFHQSCESKQVAHRVLQLQRDQDDAI